MPRGAFLLRSRASTGSTHWKPLRVGRGSLATMAATAGVAPYLITAGATLGGVLITGLLAEYRERRRSREERQRERDRLAEERWRWL